MKYRIIWKWLQQLRTGISVSVPKYGVLVWNHCRVNSYNLFAVLRNHHSHFSLQQQTSGSVKRKKKRMANSTCSHVWNYVSKFRRVRNIRVLGGLIVSNGVKAKEIFQFCDSKFHWNSVCLWIIKGHCKQLLLIYYV